MVLKLLLSYSLFLENRRSSHRLGAPGVGLAMSNAYEEQFLTLLMPSILQTWKYHAFSLTIMI